MLASVLSIAEAVSNRPFFESPRLASTGLSDVAPVTAHARSVSMIEQLAGVGYVALFVSRVVGLTMSWEILRVDTAGRSGGGSE